MADPRRPPYGPRLLLAAATTSYAASCALGAAVATGLADTRRCRWLHHVLYAVTTALTGLAAVALTVRRDPAGLALLPALAPLAVLPRTRGRTARHPVVGLAAAPFYLRSWLIGRRGRGWS